MNRRRFLELTTFSTGILAGCNQIGSSDQTTPRSKSPGQKPTEKPTLEPIQSTTPDEVAPEIETFELLLTDSPGKLNYRVSAIDESGINRVFISSTVDEAVHRFDGARNIEVTGPIQSEIGTTAEVTITVQDIAENQVTQRASSYSRQYAAFERQPLDIGAIYHPGIGGSDWDECYRELPSIGPYDAPPDRETVSRQLDQSLGFGIKRWVLRVPKYADLQRVRRLYESDLAPKISIEFTLNPRPALEEEGRFETMIERMKQHIIEAPQYATLQGRPVVSVRNLEYREGKTLYPPELISSNYSHPGEFVSTLREALTAADGTEPYILGKLALVGSDYQSRVSESFLEFAKQFDAIYNKLINPGEGTVSWDKYFRRNVSVMEQGRRLAGDLSVGFEAMVYPGWNHVINECRDSEERVPRAPEHLWALLQAGIAFGTEPRLRIDSFNDWYNGTHIEPTESAGTSYLDTVRKFQTIHSTDRERTIHYVSPDGQITGSGTEDDPIESIQEALFRAQPGDTVHVLPGRYLEKVTTVRDGEPDAPITITGPPEAVFAGVERGRSFEINHDHIHITGLMFDGVLDPSNPDLRSSYASQQIHVAPKTPRYLTGIRIMPHGVGNVLGPAVNVEVVKDIEIGEFQVIGPTGLRYVKFGDRDHLGEIVYIGTPPPQVVAHPIEGYDESNGVHVHHIDNSAGHAHSEIVNTKLGTHDVLVEYCTDGGGSQNNEENASASVRLQSYDATVRWCDLRNGKGDGVEVGSWKARDSQEEKSESELIEPEKRGGRDNAIYGNQVLGFDDIAFHFPNADVGQTPEAQKYFCGNEYDGRTDGNPDEKCPDSLPEGDGIGHLGGDSPWSGEED